jgi:signal transduction histidine kinase
MPLANAEFRSPLAVLLHALNQPLTGLQCSMEVALASPRTCEQYVQSLRQGLELTERMRALVEAIREVANAEEGKNRRPETIELKDILREAFEDLAPVAETKSVDIVLDCVVPSSLAMRADRRSMASAVFRLLESALSLANPGSVLRIETGGTPAHAWIRVNWHGGIVPAFLRPELGLLIAQAGWERAGAEWERERTEDLETVAVRLPFSAQP